LSFLRPRKKTLLTIALIVLAIALGGGFYLWRVPFDMSRYKAGITADLEDITGGSITTGDVTLRILPAPYIEVRDIKMKLGGREFMKTKLMKFRVSILPFFLKKVVLQKMVIRGWRLNIVREKDGTMALVTMYERIIKRKHVISVEDIRLEGGRLVIEDKMGGRDLRVKALLTKGLIELRSGVFKFQADLSLEDGTDIYTRGTAGKEEGKIGLKGRAMIQNLDLARLSAYIKRPALKGRVSGDIAFKYGNAIEVSGPVNYRDLTISDASVSPAPLHSPSGKATIALRADGSKLRLKASKASLAMDDFTLSGSMAVTGDFSQRENLALDLDIKTTAIPLKEVKSLVLDRVFHDKELAWINEVTPLGGAVSVKSFTMNTTVKELREGRLFSRPGALSLEADLEKLNFRHRILGKEVIDDLNGRVLIKDNSIDFNNLSAKIGAGFIKELSYKMENLHPTTDKPTSYALSLLGHMDAGRAIALTIRVFRESGESVKKQLRRISATGDTRIKFDLKGKIDVEDSTWFSVNLGLRGATFRYGGFPISFSSMDGNIDIDNSRFTFTDLALRDSANTRLKVEGYVRDYTKANPYFYLKTKGKVYGGTLAALTPGTALESLTLDEAFSLNSTISGPLKALKVAAEIDLGPARLEYGKLIKKEAGVALSMSTELLLSNNLVKIKKAALSTEGTTLNVTGSFSTGQKTPGPYSLFIEAKKARVYDLADITPLIIKRADTAGLLNIILKTERGRNGRRPGYSGLISVKNASFATSLTAEPFKDLNLFLNFEGDKAKVRFPEIKIGNSDLHGSIDIDSISGKKITFNMTSTRLDTSDIWGKGRAGITAWLKKIQALGPGGGHDKRSSAVLTGSGKISLGTGRVLGEEVRDLKGLLTMTPKAISIDPIVFITEGGTVSGKSILYRGQKSPLIFKGSASLTGLHMRELLARLGAKKKILTGTLYGNFDIRCKRGPTPFARCLNGKAYIKAERGRMWKFRVISKIFSIVNIISIDELFKKGLPYRAMTADFAIKDGMISTENLLFASDSMRMSAVMDVDSANSTIDATLGVHPFVTIDKVVTNIPLVGWIIGGEEKSSVSFYYTIKGPLKKPVVEPAPIKNIQKGILSKLGRLILSPIKLIQDSSKIINSIDKRGKSNE